METNQTQRIAGLDLLRALAILLVLLEHYPKAGGGLFNRALNFGWTGVDLFFVLSGYLIGGQLFKSLASGETVSLGSFYLRRFLRTMPNYYVILGVYFLLDPKPGWKYLVFVQNFGIHIPTAFPPSWSLCVEEQFYLLFPLAVILFRRSRWLFYAIPALLVSQFAIRAATWFAVRPDLLPEPQAWSAYMRSLYCPTYCRLDGILLGVGLAALKCFRPVQWQRLMNRGNQLLCASCVLLAVAIGLLWKHYTFWCSTAGFTVLDLSFAFLTAAALSENSVITRWKVWGAKQIAVLSYSIYLTHSLALDAAGRIFADRGTVVAIVATAALILLFACVLYYCVERPSLAFRDRLLEKAFPRKRREVPIREAVRTT